MNAKDALVLKTDGCRGVPLYTKASVYCAVFSFLSIVPLSVLLVFSADAYYLYLLREDSLVESTTAVLLFLTGLVLFAVVVMERRGGGAAIRWPYLLGALAFVWAAGEEINWGQRIFGFESPSFLLNINSSGQLNLHRIDLFDRVIANDTSLFVGAVLFLIVVTMAAFFARESSFFGVPLPSMLLILCLLLGVGGIPHVIIGEFPLTVFLRHHLLLMLLAVYAFFSKERQLFVLSSLFLIAVVLHQSVLYEFGLNAPKWYLHLETREFLFSMVFLAYAIEIFLAHRAVSEKAGSIGRDVAAEGDTGRGARHRWAASPAWPPRTDQ